MRDRFNACEWLVDRHLDAGDGDRVAIVCGDRVHTYAHVHQEIVRTAAALRAVGVRCEDRVAMALLDSVEFVAVFLGAMRIGAIPVPMNPLLPGRDLGVIVSDSLARVVVVSAERGAAIADLVANTTDVEAVITTGADAVVGATSTWQTFVADGRDGSPTTTTSESPGFWLCTSGSTGRPKLAMHRHIDLKTTSETYGAHVLDMSPDDRCFSVGPMFHAYGLGNSLSFPFAVGAATVLEPTRPPTPQLVADIVTTNRPSLFFCIPTFYAALNASAISDDTFESVRLGVSAAEPLPAETFARFRDRFGITVLDGIGSTEMLHIYLSNTPTRLRPGTSGVPVPGYDVRIVDDEDRDQPDDEPGQLLVRGDSAAMGYWARSQTTRSTFEGFWMRTGDLYSRSADGFHTYLGRVDDMLRVGGEWVSPVEVEGALIEHPGVLEAAVVGERDESGVLRPIAFVIPSEGAERDPDALAEFCRTRLAGYKRPIRYLFVDELPKTATGKIQRYVLRTAT